MHFRSFDLSTARFQSLLTCVALFAIATPARAADTLVLLPDFMTTLPVLIVAFIVVTLILNPLIFQPLLKVMEDRDERIEGARRRADQVQAKAEEALARYEESVRGAHDEAAAERKTRLDTAREELQRTSRSAKEEADREVERAREELSGSLGDARNTLRQGADDLATLAAERILGRSL